jgi:hypothetical protein
MGRANAVKRFKLFSAWGFALVAAVWVTTDPVRAQVPCIVPDNGTGTADLPPSSCGYIIPDDVMAIIDGLPPGTTIEIEPELHQFFNVATTAGGTLGGEIVTFDASMTMNMTGTGLLAGFSRLIVLPAVGEIHNAPRIPGDPVQIFDGDLISLQGQIFGDPDFDQLIVTAGSGFGLPSPGATTLTRLPEGSFNVDSFFDVAHEIDFFGAPGSILEGFGGITTATDRFQTGAAPPTIVVEKQTLPDGDLTAFLFSGDVVGTIEDGQRLVQHVSPGSYTVTEVASVDSEGPADDPWQLVSIVCDDANSTGDLASATATFNVEAGEVVTCTFTNALESLCAVDTDGDGLLDCLDPDDDNDGVPDVGDPDPLNPNACGLDSDRDTCDDCSVGVDGFGPLADDVPADDGPDADSDGVCDAGDCAPGDPGNSGMLSAVRDLQFTSADDFQWSPPLLDGGGALIYDVLRSATASDFSAATCLDTNLVALSSSDTTGPLSGVAYYLIRVEAACGGQHLGLQSPSPQRREGVSCP